MSAILRTFFSGTVDNQPSFLYFDMDDFDMDDVLWIFSNMSLTNQIASDSGFGSEFTDDLTSISSSVYEHRYGSRRFDLVLVYDTNRTDTM